MGQSRKSKKIMNMVYGLGAAIVILGALFKIMHWPAGNTMLIIGLITESCVFTVSAFQPVDTELDWSLVYPELTGGKGQDKEEILDEQGMLSKKLDEMLKEAKIDSSLMTSFGESIKDFEGAARNMVPTIDGIQSQKKYSEELNLAATQMESLNNLYKVQLESTGRQAEINDQVAENAGRLKEQMESLTDNLSNLNGVYGGMLTAMNRPTPA